MNLIDGRGRKPIGGTVGVPVANCRMSLKVTLKVAVSPRSSMTTKSPLVSVGVKKTPLYYILTLVKLIYN